MEKDYAEDFAPSLLNPSFVLEPDSTALAIIDMQYASACRTTGLGKSMKERGREDTMEYRFGSIENVVVPNIIRLLDFFRKNKLRIIYVTNGSEMPDYSDCLPHRRAFYMAWANTKGNREHEILDEIKPLQGECVINKRTSGAFNSSNIDVILRAMGIKSILFTGVSTNLCVANTARDAADRGYHCIMLEDGCTTSEETLHNATLMHARRFMGRAETTDNVIKELSTALSK